MLAHTRCMSEIQRLGVQKRWSDVVLHRGTAYFVEVADDPSVDAEAQIRQVLKQVESRLASFGSDMTKLLQVIVYLPQPEDLAIFNQLWDAWLPEGHAPSRACIHAALAAKEYRVELVVTAAVP
jgi:enamine deaminase RidA (YjgF/YER057c/UK114 family)